MSSLLVVDAVVVRLFGKVSSVLEGDVARFLQEGQAWLRFGGRNRIFVRKTKVVLMGVVFDG